MRLSNFSDLSYRVLLFSAAHPDRLVTIDEMVGALKVSRGHLMKVVHNLTTKGYLRSVRGRGGGLSLGKTPSEINLGAVLRETETDFAQVECMRANGTCTLTTICRLPHPLHEAMAAYLNVLDQYSLQDVSIANHINPPTAA